MRKWVEYNAASQMELGTPEGEAFEATTFAHLEGLWVSADQARGALHAVYASIMAPCIGICFVEYYTIVLW